MGMAMRPQVLPPQPPAIGTIGVGTKVPGGVHRPGAAVRGGIGSGRRGGAGAVSPVSWSHNAQGGLCVRPANG